jgi:hypothetical protein
MAEILYAVIGKQRNQPKQIEALFSNEGLAMTHAAKLRVGYPKTTFEVEPTEIDAQASWEPVFWAYTTMRGVHARDTNLTIQVQPDGVHEALPDSTTQHTPGDDTYGFSAYGWDEASARAAVQAMVETWYAGLSDEWHAAHGGIIKLAPHVIGQDPTYAPF